MNASCIRTRTQRSGTRTRSLVFEYEYEYEYHRKRLSTSTKIRQIEYRFLGSFQIAARLIAISPVGEIRRLRPNVESGFEFRSNSKAIEGDLVETGKDLGNRPIL